MSLTPDFLIKNVKPVTDSDKAGTFTDIRIRDGMIVEIKKDLEVSGAEEVFDGTGSYVSGG
ncbi:MAG: hypothetical protein WEC12_05915, partial [Balneolaceae bacterium]